jgi:hypothetical protein
MSFGSCCYFLAKISKVDMLLFLCPQFMFSIFLIPFYVLQSSVQCMVALLVAMLPWYTHPLYNSQWGGVSCNLNVWNSIQTISPLSPFPSHKLNKFFVCKIAGNPTMVVGTLTAENGEEAVGLESFTVCNCALWHTHTAVCMHNLLQPPVYRWMCATVCVVSCQNNILRFSQSCCWGFKSCDWVSGSWCFGGRWSQQNPLEHQKSLA